MDFRASVVSDVNSDKEKPPSYPVATTSQKHKNFVVEPMKEKSVRELAGIGLVLGGRLEEKGFCKAKDVLGQFLLLKQDKTAFKSWLRQVCFAGNRQSEDCYRCLREWCDAFL
ncbi:barrier-to-autointegration factor A-like [Leucoraja erinacea]|uniref:barrier-to-autointegration factor A-like n=1 Tax=Leucoraja erinaceus TaxID=7782 RepID=UPI002454ADA2|nr:barrier-to-autointegration factor A-like [Leucoraja erinacea]